MYYSLLSFFLGRKVPEDDPVVSDFRKTLTSLAMANKHKLITLETSTTHPNPSIINFNHCPYPGCCKRGEKDKIVHDSFGIVQTSDRRIRNGKIKVRNMEEWANAHLKPYSWGCDEILTIIAGLTGFTFYTLVNFGKKDSQYLKFPPITKYGWKEPLKGGNIILKHDGVHYDLVIPGAGNMNLRKSSNVTIKNWLRSSAEPCKRKNSDQNNDETSPKVQLKQSAEVLDVDSNKDGEWIEVKSKKRFCSKCSSYMGKKSFKNHICPNKSNDASTSTSAGKTSVKNENTNALHENNKRKRVPSGQDDSNKSKQLKSTTTTNVFTCYICGEKTTKANLKRHRQKYHPTNKATTAEKDIKESEETSGSQSNSEKSELSQEPQGNIKLESVGENNKEDAETVSTSDEPPLISKIEPEIHSENIKQDVPKIHTNIEDREKNVNQYERGPKAKKAKKKLTSITLVTCTICKKKIPVNRLQNHLRTEHDKKQAWSMKKDESTSNFDTLDSREPAIKIDNSKMNKTQEPKQTSENGKNSHKNKSENLYGLSSSPAFPQTEIKPNTKEESPVLSKTDEKEENPKINKTKEPKQSSENVTSSPKNKSENVDGLNSSQASPPTEIKPDTIEETSDLPETETKEDSKINEKKIQPSGKLNKCKSETQKVKCLYCGRSMLEKSYTRHVTEVHKKVGSKFRSKSQKSIQDAFFPKKTNENESIDNAGENTDEADDKKLSDPDILNETCYNLLKKMSEDIGILAGNQIRKPIPSDEQLPRMKNYENMKMIENLEELKSFLSGEFEYDGQNFICLICKKKNNLTSDRNISFSESEPVKISEGKLNPEFIRLKFKLKRHCTGNHTENVKEHNKRLKAEEIVKERRFLAGMKVMRVVYKMAKLNEADEKFETNLLVESKNGVDIGDINHSRRLPPILIKEIAADIRGNVKSFLQTRLEQTGYLPTGKLLFDSSTTKRTNREFVGFVCVVPNSENLINVIYMGHQPMVETRGEDVAKTVLDIIKLKSEKIVIEEEQYLGTSVDGHTQHCNVSQYIDEAMQVKSPRQHEYDYMHKAGRMDVHVRNLEEFNWLTDLTVKVGDALSYIEDAKEYGEFLKCMKILIEDPEKTEEKVYAFARYNKVRFANSASIVYNNSYRDMGGIINTLEKHVQEKIEAGDRDAASKASIIVDYINNTRFAARLAGVNDIYKVFGRISNQLQEVNVLPHERMDAFFKSLGILREMATCITNHLLCPIDENTKDVDCRWPTFHKELEYLKKGQFKGQSLGGEHPEPYPTREGKKYAERQRGLNQVEESFAELQSLVMVLYQKLNDEVFPPSHVAYIKELKQVTDLKSLYGQVKETGYLTVWNNTKQQIKTIAEKIIPHSMEVINTGVSLSEQYKSFLSKLENEIILNKNKQADSKELIKLFLNSDRKLYRGIEKVLHLICIASVGTGVESIIESHISLFKQRLLRGELAEGRANDEMMIAINGPCISQADNLLERAMKNSPVGCHFVRGDRTRKIYDTSKVLDRKKAEQSKFPFTM